MIAVSSVPAWLEELISSGEVWRYVTAAATAAVIAAVLLLARRLLIRRARTLAERHPDGWFTVVGDLVEGVRRWFLAALAVYAATLELPLGDKLAAAVAAAAVAAVLLQAALLGNTMVTRAVGRAIDKRRQTDPGAATTLTALAFVGRVAIWSTVLLLALANAGIDITAMIAGLGIGGIAVALAAQNILGDLFASASIVLDKPFVLGDSIAVDGQSGTVEHIGLKTTRVRSVTGEQIIFSNADLLKSRIHNHKRMRERRVAFTVAVKHETPPERLEALPPLLREAIEAQGQTRFDRAHFKQIGDSALVFEAVYFVLVPDYALYMDIQQAINLAILRRLAAAEIELAWTAPPPVCPRAGS